MNLRVNQSLRPSGLALFEIDLAWSCLILAIRALLFVVSILFPSGTLKELRVLTLRQLHVQCSLHDPWPP
jgi:hypothetical protein